MNPKRPLSILAPQYRLRQRLCAAAAAVALAACMGACGSDKDKVANAEPPKFQPPAAAANGPPDINSVPTQVPTPPSTVDERAKAVAGLVADRANARYSEQPARTMPVAVRPLADTPATVQAAVEKLSEPAPERPADAGSATATPTPPAQTADVAGPGFGPSRSAASLIGPRRANAPAPAADDDEEDPAAPGRRQANATPTAASGYRALTEFDSTIYGAGHLLATLDFPAGSLSASERAEIGAAATKQQQTRGVVRVIGHGPTKTSSADRAVTVARELERLGVPKDQIFTGSETSSGPTEVFVHY